MSSSSLDYQFDSRVVERYDEVRGHPPEVSKAIGAFIADQMGEGASVMELGIGTGRIALPVAAAGCEVHGVDVSSGMLQALKHRLPESLRDRVHLSQGDIARLPYADDRFDGAMAIHVLHLVADWAHVLSEIKRVVKPGGLLILGRDWIDPESFSGQIRNYFRRTVVEVGTEMMPPGASAAAAPSGGAAIVKTLMALGAQPQAHGELVGAEWETQLTPRQILDGIASRDDNESWVLPDDVLDETMRRLMAFSTSQWADLDAPQPVLRRFMIGLFLFQR